MADFCKQCSIDHFGKDFGDLAGQVPEGTVLHTLCEGCANACVDHTGQCISPSCLQMHGSMQDWVARGGNHGAPNA